MLNMCTQTKVEDSHGMDAAPEAGHQLPGEEEEEELPEDMALDEQVLARSCLTLSHVLSPCTHVGLVASCAVQ